MLGTHLGSYNTSVNRTHVGFQFSTHEAAGGNVAPNSAFEAADIRIYRAADGGAFSATQRSSSAGITMTSPFDSLTGFHDVDIDLTENTDAGFYAAGYRYSVVLAPDETVDGATLTGIVLAYFDISLVPNHALFGAIVHGTLQSATSSTAVLASATSIADDLVNNSQLEIYEGTGAGQQRVLTDWVSSTDTATVSPNWTVTPDNTSKYILRAMAPAPTATAALPPVNVVAVDGAVTGEIHGAAATGTLSTTQATSDLTGYANDQLIGRVIIWLSGDCEGEASDITDYASASGLLTFTALTTAPGDGDLFKIV